MKLNYRRTVLVGLAFLSISAFWQMYDNVVPLILTNTFHMNESLSGAIMAADNILALVLLPLFGGLSDRTRTPLGRRMPYILGGTACAVVLMNLLPRLANRYAAAPSGGIFSKLAQLFTKISNSKDLNVPDSYYINSTECRGNFNYFLMQGKNDLLQSFHFPSIVRKNAKMMTEEFNKVIFEYLEN